MFNALEQAKHYVKNAFKTDLDLEKAFYFPKNANDREIRLLFVNNSLGEFLESNVFEFLKGKGTETEHLMSIVDITSDQLQKIHEGDFSLPPEWIFEESIEFKKEEFA